MPYGLYCFVLMPFGKKADPAGRAPIDFDKIYEEVLAPAIMEVGLIPHRDDLLAMGGLVQKGIYEALLLCDFAIADLTTGNANVLYELGVRHAVRPSSTLTISAHPDDIPFDVRDLRTIRYRLNKRNELSPERSADLKDEIARELTALRKNKFDRPKFADSPLFQLIEGWETAAPESLKTDLFADRVSYDENLKSQLAAVRRSARLGGSARAEAQNQLRGIRELLGRLDQLEAGVLVDVLLTYRALEDWDAVVRLVQEMPGYICERTLVQEQLAFALNRRAGCDGADRDRALAVLWALDQQNRSTAETFGLIGRVHKDRWRAASDGADKDRHLDAALKAYSKGFRIDPRDPYPGINAAALLKIKGGARSRKRIKEILPVVEYAVRRLARVDKPTYWTYATLLEIAVIRGNERVARKQVQILQSMVRELWEPRTTSQNISDIAAAEMVRGADAEWILSLTRQLDEMANPDVG